MKDSDFRRSGVPDPPRSAEGNPPPRPASPASFRWREIPPEPPFPDPSQPRQAGPGNPPAKARTWPPEPALDPRRLMPPPRPGQRPEPCGDSQPARKAGSTSTGSLSDAVSAPPAETKRTPPPPAYGADTSNRREVVDRPGSPLPSEILPASEGAAGFDGDARSVASLSQVVETEDKSEPKHAKLPPLWERLRAHAPSLRHEMKPAVLPVAASPELEDEPAADGSIPPADSRSEMASPAASGSAEVPNLIESKINLQPVTPADCKASEPPGSRRPAPDPEMKPRTSPPSPEEALEFAPPRFPVPSPMRVGRGQPEQGSPSPQDERVSTATAVAVESAPKRAAERLGSVEDPRFANSMQNEPKAELSHPVEVQANPDGEAIQVRSQKDSAPSRPVAASAPDLSDDLLPLFGLEPRDSARVASFRLKQGAVASPPAVMEPPDRDPFGDLPVPDPEAEKTVIKVDSGLSSPAPQFMSETELNLDMSRFMGPPPPDRTHGNSPGTGEGMRAVALSLKEEAAPRSVYHENLVDALGSSAFPTTHYADEITSLPGAEMRNTFAPLSAERQSAPLAEPTGEPSGMLSAVIPEREGEILASRTEVSAEGESEEPRKPGFPKILKRLVSVGRAALPVVPHVLPLEGRIGATVSAVSAISDVLSARAGQAASTPSTADFAAIGSNLENLTTAQKVLRSQIEKQGVLIERIEDQMQIVLDATERAARAQQQLADELKFFTGWKFIFAVTLGLLLFGAIAFEVVFLLHR